MWLCGNFEGFDWDDAPIYCQQYSKECSKDYYQVGVQQRLLPA